MTLAYGLALGFGAIVVGLSFFGSHDMGDGADIGSHDVDLGAPGHDGPLDQALEGVLQAADVAQKAADAAGDTPSAMWLLTSMRFWSYGLFAFGLTGLVLGCVGVPWEGLWAGMAGVGAGAAAALAFGRLRGQTVTSPVHHAHLAGQRGVVVIAVRPGAPGKVAVTTLAGRVELPATTSDAEALPEGARVTLSAVRGGVAVVRRDS
jgi:hypothetical protein